MKQPSAITACIFLFAALLAPARAADGTRVTSGVFTFEDIGTLDISGQSGLHMTARVSEAGGRFDPKNACEFLDCVPGTPFGLGATWVSPDLGNGVFSFRGQDWQLGP